MDSMSQRFLRTSAALLRDDFLPRLREAVERLNEQEIWQRPGSASNAIGNLLLHLAGNVRQHVISGVGGAPDVRDRPAEFAAAGGESKAELLAELERTVVEAAAVLEACDPELLLEKRTIQGKEVVLLDDIYHVVEHFSYHTGQIICTMKALKGQGFSWYARLDPPVTP
jgi:uncharacterized damage-inducible protein DinB